MTWKLYAVVSAGAFVATYLVSSPPAQQAGRAPAPSARQRVAESDIEALAARLHVRAPSTTGNRAPVRDPFRFQSRAAKPAVAPVPQAFVEPPPPPPAPALPFLSLSGIASDVVEGKPVRSAVISAPAGVLIVRQGDSIAGLYTVVSIDEESVELEAPADGSRRTLRMGR